MRLQSSRTPVPYWRGGARLQGILGKFASHGNGPEMILPPEYCWPSYLSLGNPSKGPADKLVMGSVLQFHNGPQPSISGRGFNERMRRPSVPFLRNWFCFHVAGCERRGGSSFQGDSARLRAAMH